LQIDPVAGVAVSYLMETFEGEVDAFRALPNFPRSSSLLRVTLALERNSARTLSVDTENHFSIYSVEE
jgi:hypothetical protein